jgi:DNA-binding MarR family transcriptional regulator
MLPVELSPVRRKRTLSAPTGIASSEGLTWISVVSCVIGVFFGKFCLPCYIGKRSLLEMSMPLSQKSSSVESADILLGALLRVPAQAIHRRLIAELNAAGFDELRLPHIAVLQFPGPDGVCPSMLAERAGMSKQAMNQLLRSLEDLGYIVRSNSPDEGRTRIVRFTKRGHAAYSKIYDILRDIESEWSEELGPKAFAQLKELLSRVWESPLTR